MPLPPPSTHNLQTTQSTNHNNQIRKQSTASSQQPTVNSQQSTPKPLTKSMFLQYWFSLRIPPSLFITTIPKEHTSLTSFAIYSSDKNWILEHNRPLGHATHMYVPLSNDPSKKTNLVAMNSLEGQEGYGEVSSLEAGLWLRWGDTLAHQLMRGYVGCAIVRRWRISTTSSITSQTKLYQTTILSSFIHLSEYNKSFMC